MKNSSLFRGLTGQSICLFALALATGSVGACSESKAPCSEGSEACACYGNGTCDEGLACRSEVCVDPESSTNNHVGMGGQDGSGGATLSGGSSAGGDGAGGENSSGGKDGTGGTMGSGSSPGSGGNAASGGAGTGGMPGEAGPDFGCLTDDDCSGDRGACHPTRRICLECVGTSDCEAGSFCNWNFCEPYEVCGEATDCSTAGDLCSTSGVVDGRCVECTVSTHCETGFACRGNVCRPECDIDADCTEPGEICHTNGACSDCDTVHGCGVGEYCNGGKCVEQFCEPDSKVCLGGGVARCSGTGISYDPPVSCGGRGCTANGSSASCNEPGDTRPDGAVNTQGDFPGVADEWHMSENPVPLSYGMVCVTDGARTIGWPLDPEDGAPIENQKRYRIQYRTHLEESGQTAYASANVKVGGVEPPYTEFFSKQTTVLPGEEIQKPQFIMGGPTGTAGFEIQISVLYGTLCLDDVWLVKEN